MTGDVPSLKDVIVVPHTHWDREWYLPFSVFRARLVRMIKRLMDVLEADERFKTFTLDGQTIVIEDYLEIHPEDEERLRYLASNCRLTIGPWYVLPDEFLVSGESLIRNLTIGITESAKYGLPQNVGYSPDAFGHISQMPQILNGFGIYSFVFTRGMSDFTEKNGNDFIWFSPDNKSWVVATHQVDGYCNACRLGWPGEPEEELPQEAFDPNLACSRLKALLQKIEKGRRTPYAVVFNGCDHLDIQRELPDVLDYIKRKTGLNLIIGNCGDYFARLFEWMSGRELKKPAKNTLPHYRGELRSPRYHPILPGVISSRIYLKQHNARVETLLEKWAEPFSAIRNIAATVEPFCTGDKTTHIKCSEWSSDTALLRTAWKILLKNHPHDSICGCSIDDVHREMMTRFAQARQIAEDIANRSIKAIADRVDAYSVVGIPEYNDKKNSGEIFVVFNPMPERRMELVRTSITFSLASKDEPAVAHASIIQLGDCEEFIENAKISAQVVGVVRKAVTKTSEPEPVGWVDVVDVVFPAVLPPLGYATFLAQRRTVSSRATAGADSLETTVNASGCTTVKPIIKAAKKLCETETMIVAFNRNGTFDVLDKRTGIKYPQQNLIEDCADVGDEYNFAPLPAGVKGNKITSRYQNARISLFSGGPYLAIYDIRVPVEIPDSIAPDRKKRSRKKMKTIFNFTISIPCNENKIDISVNWQNRSSDHRIRVVFPAPFYSKYSYALSQFDIVKRSTEPEPWKNHREMPRPEHPSLGWTYITNGKHFLSILSDCVHEYEARRVHLSEKKIKEIEPQRGKNAVDSQRRTELCLTLLRSVGWLSRNDFPERPFNAGPSIETPEAQCHGRREFRYAVAYHNSGRIEHTERIAQLHDAFIAGVRVCQISRRRCSLPLSYGFLEISNRKIRTSSISHQTIEKDGFAHALIVRLWNTSQRKQHCTVTSALPFKKIMRVDFLNRPLNTKPGVMLTSKNKNSIDLTMDGREIATLQVLL